MAPRNILKNDGDDGQTPLQRVQAFLEDMTLEDSGQVGQHRAIYSISVTSRKPEREFCFNSSFSFSYSSMSNCTDGS
jgi:hypothetical protein